MEVVILGGAGAIGSNLARHFIQTGNRVIVFDNLTRYGVHNNLADFKKLGIKFVHGDIRCPEDFLRLPQRTPNIMDPFLRLPQKTDDHTKQARLRLGRVVIDCAAQPTAVDGYRYPRYDYTNNTDGLYNTLEYVKEHADAIIFFSTNKVYSADVVNGPPRISTDTRYVWKHHFSKVKGLRAGYGFSEDLTLSGGEKSLYGATKAASDILAREFCTAFNIPHVINRFSCMAGPCQWGKPEQGWVAWWMIAAEFDLPIQYIGWDGKQVRDVLFTPDVNRLVDKQAKELLIGNVNWGAYNVGGGFDNTLSLIEATQIVEKISGKKLQVSYDRRVRRADHCIYISDIRKVSQEFNWTPLVDIETGYRQIHKWIQNNRAALEGMYK
jgi:CDP-paratose 2-epimerase